jgi:hypothetical protein
MVCAPTFRICHQNAAVSINSGTNADPVGLTCRSADPDAQQRRPTRRCANVIVICYNGALAGITGNLCRSEACRSSSLGVSPRCKSVSSLIGQDAGRVHDLLVIGGADDGQVVQMKTDVVGILKT